MYDTERIGSEVSRVEKVSLKNRKNIQARKNLFWSVFSRLFLPMPRYAALESSMPPIFRFSLVLALLDSAAIFRSVVKFPPSKAVKKKVVVTNA